MSIAARIAVVGLLGLGTGVGGGVWAGINRDAWLGPSGADPAPVGAAGLLPTDRDGPGPTDTADPLVALETERGARAEAERRARAAEELSATTAARLRDVTDELAELRADAVTRAEYEAAIAAVGDATALEVAAREAATADAEANEAAARDAVAETEQALERARLDAEEARRRADEVQEELERSRSLADEQRRQLVELNRQLSQRGLELEATNEAFEVAKSAAEAAREELATATAAADARRRDLLRIAVRQRVDGLTAELDELWPAREEQVPRMHAWLAAAEAEVARLEEHRSSLARVEAELAGGDLDPAMAWWADSLAGLVGDLEGLADPERGPIDGVSPRFGWGVRHRIEHAESILDLTRHGRAAREGWEAAARLAAAAEPYGGLELAPQVGLLPLGPDPDSGLLEFAWLASGAAPDRGPDGVLDLAVEHAAVLVLIPGGRDWVGAQSLDRGGPNYDGVATEAEGPPREVRLSPYFIGKHELTQAQWMRLSGTNPSRYGPGTWGGREVDLAHPVTDVSWDLVTTQLARHGLRLPSEAEWEVAARGGTATPWFSGADARSLSGAVNLADRYAAANGGASWPGRLEWLDDGHTVMARAASFRPNAFGLHHVHGNVWEWCTDGFEPLARVGSGPLVDPTVPPERSTRRVVRGGAYNSNAIEARSANRGSYPPTTTGAALGIRLARSLDPQ